MVTPTRPAAPRPDVAPHIHGGDTTVTLMAQVLLATLPGLLALTLFFGWGTLINIVLAATAAMLCEAGVTRLRGISPGLRWGRGGPAGPRLPWGDGSTLVTAVLLGLALPPLAPWWLPVLGTAFAVIVAKHLYGGLGQNPFNPAMAGYAMLLVSFPLLMSRWPLPLPVLADGVLAPGPIQSLHRVLLPGAAVFDGLTGATPLEAFRHHSGLLVAQLYAEHPLYRAGHWAGVGWEWVNVGFLAGGIWLLYRRIISWHAPVAMLITLSLLALLFYDGGSSVSKGSPLFHLFSGATMLGAFFIVTDPATCAGSRTGRLLCGALTGALVFLLRTRGHYPDGVAFAVLLMNCAAPLIDHYTLPRGFGGPRRRRNSDAESGQRPDPQP